MTIVSDKIEIMDYAARPFTVLAVEDSAVLVKWWSTALLGQECEVPHSSEEASNL